MSTKRSSGRQGSSAGLWLGLLLLALVVLGYLVDLPKEQFSPAVGEEAITLFPGDRVYIDYEGTAPYRDGFGRELAVTSYVEVEVRERVNTAWGPSYQIEVPMNGQLVLVWVCPWKEIPRTQPTVAVIVLPTRSAEPTLPPVVSRDSVATPPPDNAGDQPVVGEQAAAKAEVPAGGVYYDGSQLQGGEEEIAAYLEQWDFQEGDLIGNFFKLWAAVGSIEER